MVAYCSKCGLPQKVNGEVRLCSCGSYHFQAQPLRRVYTLGKVVTMPKRSREFTGEDLRFLKLMRIAPE